eukprot:3203002-Rhodomonas_salina.1
MRSSIARRRLGGSAQVTEHRPNQSRCWYMQYCAGGCASLIRRRGARGAKRGARSADAHRGEERGRAERGVGGAWALRWVGPGVSRVWVRARQNRAT